MGGGNHSVPVLLSLPPRGLPERCCSPVALKRCSSSHQPADRLIPRPSAAVEALAALPALQKLGLPFYSTGEELMILRPDLEITRA